MKNPLTDKNAFHFQLSKIEKDGTKTLILHITGFNNEHEENAAAIFISKACRIEEAT